MTLRDFLTATAEQRADLPFRDFAQLIHEARRSCPADTVHAIMRDLFRVGRDRQRYPQGKR